jgi:dihydroorotate dehydrogenase (fumarate)
MVLRLDEAGADALVLFNRFFQPEIDLDKLTVEPHVGLSDPAEARLPRAWIALLHGRVNASLAATTGVGTSVAVTSMRSRGADAVMTASALLRHGPGTQRIYWTAKVWMARKGSRQRR